jgi:hypothetical protein
MKKMIMTKLTTCLAAAAIVGIIVTLLSTGPAMATDSQPRFIDNGDGTVKDNQTGLIWLKDANCLTITEKRWDLAVELTGILADGKCGLSDGSREGEWRLPNIKEMQSLLDYNQYYPALPVGNPFTLVLEPLQTLYWTSTSLPPDIELGDEYAWTVELNYGNVDRVFKQGRNWHNAWPVRDRQ